MSKCRYCGAERTEDPYECCPRCGCAEKLRPCRRCGRDVSPDNVSVLGFAGHTALECPYCRYHSFEHGDIATATAVWNFEEGKK